MEIKPIKTEKDYDKALERLELIFDAATNSKKGDEAEILSMLIENYENKHYPIESPDLNRKKRLTVEMIRELERILHISASVLVNNYQLSK